ncbi:MAG: CehA/McbA family metallohydrolase [Chloroflexota bacterium]
MARRWLKGNTHTHTRYSDGDSPPETVVDWYEAHGYDFLFLTDHNILIPDDHLAKLQRGSLPVWQGEEVTMAAVHVNALGVQELIAPPWPGKSLMEPEVKESHTERLRWALAQIAAQGAVAHVNHPNYLYTLTIDDLLAAGEVGLVEMANGHNAVNNEGDESHPSTEVIWDALLTAGGKVWGVASDDAHHFQTWGENYSNPGRGWLRVEAESARMADVLEAVRAGRFYASSGLELAAYEASGSELSLELAGDAAIIELIGQGGAVLESVNADRARFVLGAATGPYARVRATASDGRQLWTQPLFR